jgi:O-antigen/teichoic acid export membrane protein
MLKEILNTLWTKIVSAVVALLILVLTTQYLGADGRGLLSLISSSFGTIGIFAGFVGGPAVVFLASRKKLQYLLLPVYGWSIIVAVIGTIVVWFLGIVTVPYILSVGILSILSSVYIANFYVLVGLQKVRINNLIYLFQWIVNFAMLVVFFVLLREPFLGPAIVAIGVSYIFGLCLTFYEIKKVSQRVPFDLADQIADIKTLVKISFFAQAAAVMCYLNYRLGIFALGNFSGLSAVGIYSVGINIAEFILLASQSLALVGYSRISNTDNREYSRDITIKLTKFGFILTTVITTILVLIPPPVYIQVFGRDFALVPSVLLTMSPGIIAFGSSIIIFNYFAGIGKNQINACAACAGFAVNSILCYTLIPHYDLQGAGITASIAFIVMSAILVFAFSRDTTTGLEEFLISNNDIAYLFIKIGELNIPPKKP